MKRVKIIFPAFCFLLICQNAFSKNKEPSELQIFRKAYPDITFESEYDISAADWKIKLTIPSSPEPRKAELYWCNGSFVPESELKNKEKYWPLLYRYDYGKPPADPSTFTKEQIEQMRNFGSDESRKNGAGTPMFFFDEIYDSKTRGSLEAHIKKISFLNHSVNVHERMKEPLSRVEAKIMKLAETDSEVQNFLENINRNEAYYWRVIANTNRKSFHSLGIAVDITPKRLNGKAIYWSWTKDINPEGWMLTPLKARWMPPESVIKAFEDEGFIWGGKWAIWDNMHFEYHPELIYFSTTM